MLLNASPLNSAALNADSSAGGSLVATIGMVASVSGTLTYQINLSSSAASVRSVMAIPYAQLTSTIAGSQSIQGAPSALFVVTLGKVVSLTPQLYALMNPVSFSSLQSVTGSLWALLSGTISETAAVTNTVSVQKFFVTSIAQAQSFSATMAGVWNCTLACSFSITSNPTLQISLTASIASVNSVQAYNSALLTGTLGQVQAVTSVYGVYLLPSATLGSSISITATQYAQMIALAALSKSVIGTVTTQKLMSLAVAQQKSMYAALYSFVPPITVSRVFSIRCNIAISGTGRKLGGKIARDVQRPYLGEKVS